MAFFTTTTGANFLQVTYNRERQIIPHERIMTPFFDEMQAFADGGKPLGSERKFFVRTGDSHSYGYVSDGGDYPEFTAPTGLQGSVTAKEIATSLKMTTLLQLVGQGEGSLVSSDIINDQVMGTIRNQMTIMDFVTLGVATARIATVESTVTTSSTFVAALPQSVFQLRKNQLVDFYTGSSAGETGKKIGYVNYKTRVVTLASGVTVNATAADGVYITASYNPGIFGLREVVDDGTNGATTIYGITRSTSPEINATLITPGSGLQTWSEELARQACVTAKMQVGVAPDEIWCNDGIVAAHFASLTGNRMFTVAVGDGGVPKYRGGGNVDETGIYFDGKLIPFRVDNNLPAREAYFIHKPYFRKHVLRKSNWIGDNVGPDGSASPYFSQAPAATGQRYASAAVTALAGFLNMANLMPRSCVALTSVADAALAGD